MSTASATGGPWRGGSVGCQSRGFERRDVGLVGQGRHDCRPAGRECAEPRAGRLERGRPAEAQADVDRGNGLIEGRIVEHAGREHGIRDAKRGREVLEIGGGVRRPGQDQPGGRRVAAHAGEGAQDLRQAPFGGQPAEDAKDQIAGAEAEPGAALRAFGGGPRLVAALPEGQIGDGRVGGGPGQARHRAPGVRGDGPRRLQHGAGHRPEVIVGAVEAMDGELGGPGAGLGLVEAELGPVVRPAARGSRARPRAWCRRASWRTVRPG